MNAQELFDAFRAVDPAWMKEADLLADRVAEQASCKEIQEEPENEIQKLFANYKPDAAKPAAHRTADEKSAQTLQTDAFAELTGTPSVLPVQNAATRPAKHSGGLFRKIGGIAAAVALCSITAVAVSVITSRNGGMTVTPGLQPMSSDADDTPRTESHFIQFDTEGNVIAEGKGNRHYLAYYQDLLLQTESCTALQNDGYSLTLVEAKKLPKIYQPKDSALELTLAPASETDFVRDCKYRVFAQMNGKTLDITDLETGETRKTLEFTTAESYEENCRKISLEPDYSKDGAVVDLYFMTLYAGGTTYGATEHYQFQLYGTEPGTPCTYQADPPDAQYSFDKRYN